MPSADHSHSGRFQVVRFRPEQAAAGAVLSEPRAGRVMHRLGVFGIHRLHPPSGCVWGAMGRPARFIRRCRQPRCTPARDRAVRWRSPNPESNILGRHLGRWDAQPSSMGQAHGRGGDTAHVPLGFLTTSASRLTWPPVAGSTRHLAAGNAVAGCSTAQRLNSHPAVCAEPRALQRRRLSGSVPNRTLVHVPDQAGTRVLRTSLRTSPALGSRYRPVRTRFRE